MALICKSEYQLNKGKITFFLPSFLPPFLPFSLLSSFFPPSLSSFLFSYFLKSICKFLCVWTLTQSLFYECPHFFGATPVAYGGSQARGRVGAAAAGLHHSHSNTGSEPCLQSMLQLVASPDPYPTERDQGLNPHPHGYNRVHNCWATRGTPECPYFIDEEIKDSKILSKPSTFAQLTFSRV